MMMTKATFKYILGRRKGYPRLIELQIYKGAACRVYISTRFNDVDPREWDERKEEMKPKADNARLINDHLHALVKRIERAELEAEAEGRTFGREEIKAAAKGDDKPAAATVLDTICQMRDKSVAISPKTLSVYNAAIKALSDFLTQAGKQDVATNRFTAENLAEFDKWMRQTFKPTTVHQFHCVIRNFMSRAVKFEVITKSPYAQFNEPKAHTVRREMLTEMEVTRLENIDRSRLSTNEQVMLDRFLFSIYTGLRRGDNCRLSERDIRQESGGLVLDMVTEKQQGKHIVLPLFALFGGKAQEIAQRYMNERHGAKTLFPEQANEPARILARIMAMVGVDRHISFHCARHTCASLLAEKTGNPFVIMQVLGHSDIKTSMIYIHNSYSAMVRSLENVKWG